MTQIQCNEYFCETIVANCWQVQAKILFDLGFQRSLVIFAAYLES